MKQSSNRPYVVGVAAGVLFFLAAVGVAYSRRDSAAADLKTAAAIRDGALADNIKDGVTFEEIRLNLEKEKAAAEDFVQGFASITEKIENRNGRLRELFPGMLKKGSRTGRAELASAFNRLYLFDMSRSDMVEFPDVSDFARFDALMDAGRSVENAERLRTRLYLLHQLVNDAADVAEKFVASAAEKPARKPVELVYAEQRPADKYAQPEQAAETSGDGKNQDLSARGSSRRGTRRTGAVKDAEEAHPDDEKTGDYLAGLPVEVVFDVEPPLAAVLQAEWLDYREDTGRLLAAIQEIKMEVTDTNRIRITAVVAVFGRVLPPRPEESGGEGNAAAAETPYHRRGRRR